MSKVTGWINWRLVPVRVGVYERNHPSWGICFSYYNGKTWMFPGYTTQIAWNNRKRLSECQYAPWRGLTKETK